MNLNCNCQRHKINVKVVSKISLKVIEGFRLFKSLRFSIVIFNQPYFIISVILYPFIILIFFHGIVTYILSVNCYFFICKFFCFFEVFSVIILYLLSVFLMYQLLAIIYLFLDFSSSFHYHQMSFKRIYYFFFSDKNI